jgi:hypothetical protein
MIDDEKNFIFNEYQSALEALDIQKDIVEQAREHLAEIKKRVDDTKQAMIDYMVGNGMEYTQVGDNWLDLSTSYSVDIFDKASVPEEYMRTKITSEPDKNKIKGARPMGNWYSIKESPKLTVRKV